MPTTGWPLLWGVHRSLRKDFFPGSVSFRYVAIWQEYEQRSTHFNTALGSDIDGLSRSRAVKYAQANIYLENFDAGIDLLESAFDLDSISEVDDLNPIGACSVFTSTCLCLSTGWTRR